MTGRGHKNLQRLVTFYFVTWIPVTHGYGFPGSSDGKVSAYNVGGPGSIPGSGRAPGEGNGNPIPSILARKIPRMEEPGGLQSMGSQRVGHVSV